MPEGDTPNPTPTPTPSHPAFGGPPASSGSSLVQITAEEFQRLTGLRSELDTFRSKYAADLAAKEAERLTAMAKAGDIEKALETQRQSWEQKLAEAQTSFAKVRDQYHGKAKSEVIAAALAGREFSGDKPEVQVEVAAQLRAQIEPLFETYEDTQGNLIVREKGTGRPAADALRELLNAPKYQIYFTPKSRGGSGTDGTRSASAGQQANPNENPHPIGTRQWFEWKAMHANVGTDPMWRKPTQ